MLELDVVDAVDVEGDDCLVEVVVMERVGSEPLSALRLVDELDGVSMSELPDI